MIYFSYFFKVGQHYLVETLTKCTAKHYLHRTFVKCKQFLQMLEKMLKLLVEILPNAQQVF